MSSIYCVCDYSNNCNCLGTEFEGDEGCTTLGSCPSYTDDSIYGPGILNVSFTNTNTCDAYYPAGSVDVNEFTSYIEDNVEVGELIGDDDIKTLWDAVDELETLIGKSLGYTRPTEMSAGDKIYATHVLYALYNLQLFTSPTADGTYYDGETTGLITLQTDYSIAPRELIRANQFKTIAAWMTTIASYCICDSYNMTICCQCDVVCDCNY